MNGFLQQTQKLIYYIPQYAIPKDISSDFVTNSYGESWDSSCEKS